MRWLVLSLLIVAGCATAPTVVGPPEPSSVQILVKTVTATNWLVTIGLLTCAAGVYAFFSGNSKAAAIIAAGITLVGGVAVLAASTALMVSWLPLLKWIVPVLGIIAVGLWAYQHYYRSKKIETLEMVKDYLDSDKDGRVTAADIKTVLGIG